VIGLLRGELVEKSPAEALVLAGGVGYEIQIPLSAFDKLPAPGSEVTLHVHCSVREDSQTLYGFTDAVEKQLFRHLIKVNGVGPRIALAVLSGLGPAELAAAVREGDIARLARTPGIGRRTAERIVMELRDRLDDAEVPAQAPSGTAASARFGGREAEAALISLGYKPQQAARPIARILRDQPQLDNTEGLVRLALQGLAPDAGSSP